MKELVLTWSFRNVLYGVGKLLFGKQPNRKAPHAEQNEQTIFDYPEGGYGLDDDPVVDELMLLDLMDEED